MPDLVAGLAAITGPAHVLDQADVVAGYATDWTRRYQGAVRCVVLPDSTAQVAAVLAHCAQAGVPVVPQGGNTGMVGGGVPAADQPAVILSTRRLTGVDPVDAAAAEVTAAAGATIAQLRAQASAAGLEYGVDLASRDTATVGGTIATNAGGIATIRYGPTRAQLRGITAVLADGTVLPGSAGSPGTGTGYNLAQLLAGSEGTLAVITAARLRLWPAERPALVLLAGVDGIGAASRLAAGLHAAGGLRAAEYLDGPVLAMVCRVAGLTRPAGAERRGYLLAEISDSDSGGERPAPADLPPDTAIGMDGRSRSALWAYRERVTESIATLGIPHKVDVFVPPAGLESFRSELDTVVSKAASGPAEVLVFGHIGVGNLHVNVLGPDPRSTAVDEAVARLAVAHGGTISAEHGVGRAKAAWLDWSMPGPTLAAMRAIKSALDPAGLLNPGVLLPPEPARRAR
jgi:FAD/FMN-containing dehydrogenase